MDKALAVLDQCPDLERIVYVEPRGIRYRYDHPKLLAWDELLALGAAHRAAHPGAVEQRMAEATPGRHRHAHLHLRHHRAAQGRDALGGQRGVRRSGPWSSGGGFASPPPGQRDLILSYLPLCHVAERVFTIWFNAGAGVQVNFARVDRHRAAEPARGAADDPVRRAAHLGAHPRRRHASGCATPRCSSGPTRGCGCGVADRIGATLVRTGGRHTVGDPAAVRRRLGLLLPRRCASGSACAGSATPPRGAAPIAPEVLRFFMGIGVPMHEVYGMTENTAIAHRQPAGPGAARHGRRAARRAPRSASTRRPARS